MPEPNGSTRGETPIDYTGITTFGPYTTSEIERK